MSKFSQKALAFKESVSSLGAVPKWLFIIFAGIVSAAILFWITDKLFLLSISRSYVDQIALVFQMNRHLAEAISLIVSVLLAACLSCIFSFSRRRRLVGILGVVGLLVANSLALFAGTKNQFFEASGTAIKCYVMTKDGPRFGEQAGVVDPMTGKPCKAVTPDMVERLQKYSSGARPREVTDANPVFFDERTGEPNLWFSIAANGQIKLFDLVGFDPETGQELKPVTTETPGVWSKQVAASQRRKPELVDPAKYGYFDTVTGKPRVWYWHGKEGEWEFYNNPGYRPTGELLTIVSAQIIDDYKNEIAMMKARARAQEVAAQQERAEAEQRAAAQRVEEASRQAAQKAADDARQTALLQAGENCDRAAANPYDPAKPSSVVGVEYSDLKATAQSAADLCRNAVSAYPNEPRYKYNLARAVESINPQQAINLYVPLARQNYVAAHDNLAGLIWRERKDLPGAIVEWQAGARAGDPSAMVSIAWLIKKNLYSAPDPVAARVALLQKAAELGHRGAQDMLDQEREEIQARYQQQQNQQQQQQMMLNLFGGVMRGIAR